MDPERREGATVSSDTIADRGSTEAVDNPALAVLAKLRLLYAETDEDAFLSFPVIGVPLTEADFAFADPDDDRLSPQERKQAERDFATLVNQVPTVGSVWNSSGHLLWDEYGMVFRQTEWARTELSDADRETLAAAEATTGDPEVREAYLDHQEAYVEAKLTYNNARLTIENAEDPAVREEAEAELPRLEAIVEQAQRDWVTHGHKYEYERSVTTIDRLQRIGTQTLREEWRDSLERAKEESVIDQSEFYKTGFRPRNFHRPDGSGWATMTVDGSEVTALCEQARVEMPELVDSPLVSNDIQADVRIERLSVEVAVVDIDRVWFDRGVLRNRHWRWRHDRDPLSDGGDPPKGRLPAYATKLVFARNLSVELTPESARNRRAVDRLQTGKLLTLGPVLLEPAVTTTESAGVTMLRSATLDPRETLALREINAELTLATRDRDKNNRSGEPRPFEVRTHEADLAKSDTRLSALASLMAGSNSQTSVSGLTARKTKRLITPITTLKPAPLQVTPVLNTGPTPVSRAVPFTGPTVQRHGLPTTHQDSRDHRTKVRDHRTKARDHGTKVRDHRTKVRESTTVPATRRGGGYQGQVLGRDPEGGTSGPVESARITFEAEDGTLQRTVQSDADGRYQVDLPPGRYVVSAHRYGYEDYTTRPGYFVREGNDYQTGNLFLVRLEDEMDLWESMQLLAFICQSVPKSPDPDPDSELIWSLS